MKQLILSLMLVAFAAAVQAGDTKAVASKDKSTCCDTKVVEQTKAGSACCASCDKGKKVTAKPALKSPKAAAELAKK